MKNNLNESCTLKRLNEVLNQKKSKIESLREFQRKLHSVLPLISNLMQLDFWLEARERMGLLEDRDVKRYADNIVRLIYKLDEEAQEIKSKKPKPIESNHQKLCERAERERQVVRKVGYVVTPPSSLSKRMSRAFNRLLDQEIAMVQREAPP